MKSMEPIFPLRFNLPDRTTSDRSAQGLLRSLHAQLRSAIQDGRLKAGVQLPPSRLLAQTLGISRNTVLAAYDLLLSEGYLRARRGAGTYVEDVGSKLARRTARPASNRPAAVNKFWRHPPGLFGGAPKLRYDFGVGVPDVSQFPFVTWRRLAGRALRALSKDNASSGDPQGSKSLRAAIATHVSFTRAIACEAGDIIVTAGAQQAFDLLARILVTPKRSLVALEVAHYSALRHVLAAAGARFAMVPLDEAGIVAERIPARASIVCVTPSHQFPLGLSMSLQRRLSLLRFAREHNACIIEDDYDGEYRFGNRPLDALQTLDTEGRVFYVGTFSKSLFPALRLGYIVAPAWARTALISAKQLTDRHSSVSTQDALAAFIDEGHLARHVRKMTRIYADRRTALFGSMDRHCENRFRLIPSSAGLHITAELLIATPAETIRRRAAEVGVKVQSLDQCCVGDPPLNAITFGYGGIATQDVDAGIRLLAGVIGKKRRADRKTHDAKEAQSR